MIYITSKQIAAITCDSMYVETFRDLFGNEAAITPKNVERAVDEFGIEFIMVLDVFSTESPQWETNMTDYKTFEYPMTSQELHGIILMLYAQEQEVEERMGDKYEAPQ